ncbi:6-hydroxy-3-succinoylpyridine 3-monooxygenase HspA [Tolypothrix tenuis PCC 7101]|uniref:6-hydroxy-3-succinoylpyridine 3-monooxygenase HspA n=1 Tax=Tolypothrix tenuis PCC 7101 TaxID=231146 RepID=A0A1Z4N433_9CYAN|nr:NYN domain-containing protein [Aulosira sp. FACHB-113]BAZ00484.1 6-hydroxy-3-succinoylpyridine 3-monooxygenase HspA [Tolypothrix tenuis PCC 7101]BAZ75594.1 6-hydroxy-3-succinoylpyridine 3-monooxygenase HspA [Aulosira laxa NIES-50]
MKTNVYVDGFNLYYGSLKDSPYKWLNLHTLVTTILKQSSINHIKYFTARVKARPQDPSQAVRQDTYLRALKTIPHVTVIEGTFLSSRIWMPLAANPAEKVKVIKTEEKGSDVNLAVHLVSDAYKQEFEQAIVISNDSDLCEAIKIVRSLKLNVGILHPHKRPSIELSKHAHFIRPIREGALQGSQFPHTLHDKAGSFHKPDSW